MINCLCIRRAYESLQTRREGDGREGDGRSAGERKWKRYTRREAGGRVSERASEREWKSGMTGSRPSRSPDYFQPITGHARLEVAKGSLGWKHFSISFPFFWRDWCVDKEGGGWRTFCPAIKLHRDTTHNLTSNTHMHTHTLEIYLLTAGLL